MEKELSFEKEKKRKKASAGHRISTQDMVLGGVFTTLIAVGAFIKVPVPVLPFTLQFLFTMLAGLLLGGRKGALSVGVYILLGLLGVPVFAEGGGIWYIWKPSFGYLLGFMAAAYVTGSLVERKGKLMTKWVIGVNFLGLLIVYGIGMVYYYVICNYVIDAPIAVGVLLVHCFVLTVPGDICLCILAAILTVRVRPVFQKMTGNAAGA